MEQFNSRGYHRVIAERSRYLLKEFNTGLTMFNIYTFAIFIVVLLLKSIFLQRSFQ